MHPIIACTCSTFSRMLLYIPEKFVSRRPLQQAVSARGIPSKCNAQTICNAEGAGEPSPLSKKRSDAGQHDKSNFRYLLKPVPSI